jgi:hypothetical protein
MYYYKVVVKSQMEISPFLIKMIRKINYINITLLIKNYF